MNILAQTLILVSCFGLFLCDYDSECISRGKEKLDGFVVTWEQPGVDNPWAFDALPKTIKEAEAKNWTLLDDGCTNSSSPFKGKRYILGDDVSVLIIYDGQGHVAGIQANLPKDIADKEGASDFMNFSAVYYDVINGNERYDLTMYFINPDSVCKGRTDEEVEEQGTITQLYIRNGQDIYLAPPMIGNNSTFTEQKMTSALCVPTMGEHLFYQVEEGMDCTKMVPYFIVYDCGRLIALQLFLIGNVAHDPRYEHVPKEQMRPFIGNLPKCILDLYNENTSGFTTFHVFFVPDPKNVTCPAPPPQ